MEGYELGRERGTKGENVQRIRSMNGRYKIDRGRLRICLLYTSDAADDRYVV